MLVIVCILVLTHLYICFYRSKKNIHMLQQNLYNENNRYLKWVWKNKNQFLDLDLFLNGISIIGIIGLYQFDFISVVLLIMIALIWLLLGVRKQRELSESQQK